MTPAGRGRCPALLLCAVLASFICVSAAHEQMPNFDLYAELEVPPGANAAAIRRAYKTLARRYHPDRNGGTKDAQDKFVRVQTAYEILENKEKREEYDEFRRSGRQRAQPQQWQPQGGYRMYTYVGADGRVYMKRVWEGAPPSGAFHAGSGGISLIDAIIGSPFTLLAAIAIAGVLLARVFEAAAAAPLPQQETPHGSKATTSRPDQHAPPDAATATAAAGTLSIEESTRRCLDAVLNTAASASLQPAADDAASAPLTLPALLPLLPQHGDHWPRTVRGGGRGQATSLVTRQLIVAVLHVVPASPSAGHGGLAFDEASRRAHAALIALAERLSHDPVVIAWVPSPASLAAVAAAASARVTDGAQPEEKGALTAALKGALATLGQWSKRICRLGHGSPSVVFIRWKPGVGTAKSACFPAAAVDRDRTGDSGAGGAGGAPGPQWHGAPHILLEWAELLLQGNNGGALVDATDVLQPLLGSVVAAE
jgi:curved DNA-binding protein CbpA